MAQHLLAMNFRNSPLRTVSATSSQSPYNPASNDLAESVVQTFKEGLKKLTEGSVDTKLDYFLFQYRLTPHSTTGKSPAELLMGRQP